VNKLLIIIAESHLTFDIFMRHPANAGWVSCGPAVTLQQTKTRGHSPNDDAAMNLLFLVLRHAAKAWKMQPREWVAAKTQFVIHLRRQVLRGMLVKPPQTQN
jgi:hypothetical protein